MTTLSAKESALPRPSPLAGSDSPQAIGGSTPSKAAPAGASPEPTINTPTSMSRASARTKLRSDHGLSDARVPRVAADQPPPRAIQAPTTTWPAPVVDQAQPAAMLCSLPRQHSPLADSLLTFAADVLDDLEKVKLANENRLRHVTRGGPDDERIRKGKYKRVEDLPPDKDGERREFKLPLSHPQVARLAGLIDGLAKLEHEAVLELQRALRRHPLGEWQQSVKGIGEKQGARLIGAIGNPYIRPEIEHDDGVVEPSRPRRVAELWAYCGYRPGQRRRKGERANWSSIAKSKAYLVAEKMLQCGNRELYDKRRAVTAERVHTEPCAPCGPKGHPAQPGSAWSAGHQHADALRIVAKHVLKDLWRAARDIHLGHVNSDNHQEVAEVDQ